MVPVAADSPLQQRNPSDRTRLIHQAFTESASAAAFGVTVIGTVNSGPIDRAAGLNPAASEISST